MVKIKATIKGVSPLLHNRFFEDEKTTSRSKKVYIPEEEAEKRCYKNDKGDYVFPSTHLKSCMIKAGTDFIMKGRKTYKEFVKSGIMFDEQEVLLKFKEKKILSVPVVIQRARIMRSRPMFMDWSAEFTFEVLDDMLDTNVLKEILETAGKFQGIGDFRPEYGRFEVTSFKKS